MDTDDLLRVFQAILTTVKKKGKYLHQITFEDEKNIRQAFQLMLEDPSQSSLALYELMTGEKPKR